MANRKFSIKRKIKPSDTADASLDEAYDSVFGLDAPKTNPETKAENNSLFNKKTNEENKVNKKKRHKIRDFFKYIGDGLHLFFQNKKDERYSVPDSKYYSNMESTFNTTNSICKTCGILCIVALLLFTPAIVPSLCLILGATASFIGSGVTKTAADKAKLLSVQAKNEEAEEKEKKEAAKKELHAEKPLEQTSGSTKPQLANQYETDSNRDLNQNTADVNNNIKDQSEQDSSEQNL